MALSHLFGKDRTISIDIGSVLIKIMQIEASGGSWRVSRAVVHPTPPGTCHDGMVTDIDAVATAVKDALRGADIHASGALAAVSGSQVLVRQVQLPKMSEAVLRKSIRFEAAKYISANVEDSIVEFEIIDHETADGQMQVMLVAAPRDLIESRVAVIERVGLEPLVVDVEAFSLIRSLVEHSQDPSIAQDTVALLDMGAGHTDLNIVSEGRFALTRNIPIAGNSLTQAIKSLINCEDAQAEALKQAVHIGPKLAASTETPDENLVKAARAIQPLLDELLREIRRSLHYFQSQFPDNQQQKTVSRLLLTGGTSRMSGLADYISAKLGVRARLLNLLSDGVIQRGSLTEEDAKSDGPLFGIAAGLALKDAAPPSRAHSAQPQAAQAPDQTEQTAAQPEGYHGPRQPAPNIQPPPAAQTSISSPAAPGPAQHQAPQTPRPPAPQPTAQPSQPQPAAHAQAQPSAPPHSGAPGAPVTPAPQAAQGPVPGEAAVRPAPEAQTAQRKPEAEDALAQALKKLHDSHPVAPGEESKLLKASGAPEAAAQPDSEETPAKKRKRVTRATAEHAADDQTAASAEGSPEETVPGQSTDKAA
ncbi:MAG: type IV pilus assembly protein PilM [Armatimonadetes bacterium]|nr:type IV pilus assembly protein PilM [Armatimonadota bacterium]